MTHAGGGSRRICLVAEELKATDLLCREGIVFPREEVIDTGIERAKKRLLEKCDQRAIGAMGEQGIIGPGFRGHVPAQLRGIGGTAQPCCEILFASEVHFIRMKKRLADLLMQRARAAIVKVPALPHPDLGAILI